jgi:PhnB protein
VAFHPYLTFGGNCREALTRYHEIFGGDLVVMTMAEMPGAEGEMPEEMADLVMHAALTFGDNLLMASDDPTGGFDGVRGMNVNYEVAGVDEAKRVFEALAEGGEVTMPAGETFWSPMFGMCIDRFGVPWMVSAEAPADAS